MTAVLAAATFLLLQLLCRVFVTDGSGGELPRASTSEITVQTLGTQPSQPPHNVTLEAGNSTSIIIRWEPPLEGENGVITGYKIRYRRNDKRHWTSITTQSNQRMYQLNGLEELVVYQVRICALNVNGTGPWSDMVDIELYDRYLDESKLPNAPTNLKTKAMSDSILVSWSPPKDKSIRVRGYNLGWGKGFPDEHTQKLDSKQRYFTIESLEPSSEYVIGLRATNEIGEGTPAYANVMTMERSVPESVSPLIPPVGLKAIVLSASTMVLYWTDSTLSHRQKATDKRYYVVRYTSHHHSSNPRYKYYNSSDLNCMIDDLRPNTQYEFTVKLVKGRRESPWSIVVLNQTQKAAPSSPPRDLTVQCVRNNPNAVMLHWQPPEQSNGPITGYVIAYTTDNTKWGIDSRVEAIIGDQTEIMIKIPQSSTNYYFKIQARSSKGYGPFSSAVQFKTPESACQDQSQNGGLIDGGESPGNYLVQQACKAFIATACEQMSVFFQNQTKPNVQEKSTAKTCKDLFVADPDKPTGQYWIDPNDGDTSDAILVHCDAETRSTCITPEPASSRNITYVGDEVEVWLSEMGDGITITYTADSSQIGALQMLSSHAEQNVTYRCINSVGYFDAEGQTYERGLKLMAWTGVKLEPRGSRHSRYDMMWDECRDRPNEWRETVIGYRTDRPVLLPVMDVGLRDVGKPDQSFAIEFGNVCFK